jgi:hypothetical protein
VFPLAGISGGRDTSGVIPTLAVYQDICALAVRTQEYGILINVGLRQTGQLVHRLEELARALARHT